MYQGQDLLRLNLYYLSLLLALFQSKTLLVEKTVIELSESWPWVLDGVNFFPGPFYLHLGAKPSINALKQCCMQELYFTKTLSVYEHFLLALHTPVRQAPCKKIYRKILKNTNLLDQALVSYLEAFHLFQIKGEHRHDIIFFITF